MYIYGVLRLAKIVLIVTNSVVAKFYFIKKLMNVCRSFIPLLKI